MNRIIQLEESFKHPDKTSHARPGCPNPELWTTPGSPNSELELWEFLYGLVRVLKPKVVFESGCHRGFATRAMGLAIQDNEYGRLFSCDTEAVMVAATQRQVKPMPVVVYHRPALECPELLECDFLFCDSSYESRVEELILLKQGAIAVVHDTYQEQALRDNVELFQNTIHFNTPRGFSMLQVTKSRARGSENSCNCIARNPKGGCIIHERRSY